MSRKRADVVLGYTRTGRPVLLPIRGAAETFVGWTRGDHADASRILLEQGEREGDPDTAVRITRRASHHWDQSRSTSRRSRRR